MFAAKSNLVVQLACIAMVLSFPLSVCAEQSPLFDAPSIGIGLGLINNPEELEYEPISPSFSTYLEWHFAFVENISARFGYTATRSELNFTAYKTDWRYILTTQTVYLGYKGTLQRTEKSETYLIFGLAYVISDLQTNTKESPTRDDAIIYNDSGFGLLGAAGVSRYINQFIVGLQLEILSRQSRFNGIENASGHNLLLLTGGYRF